MVDVCKAWMGASAQAQQSDGGSWCTPKYSGQLKTTAASEYPASSSSGHIHARKANSSATGACKHISTHTAQARKQRTTTRFRHLAASQGFLLLRPLAQSRQDSRSGAAKSRQQSESDVRQACGRPCECSPSRAARRVGESCGKVSQTGSQATAQTWERKVSAAAHGTREALHAHQGHKQAAAAYDGRVVSAQPVVGTCQARRSAREERRSSAGAAKEHLRRAPPRSRPRWQGS